MANAYYAPATQSYGNVAPQQKNYPEAPAVQSGFGDDPAIAREVATVQGQILIAKRFPRDVSTTATTRVSRISTRGAEQISQDLPSVWPRQWLHHGET